MKRMSNLYWWVVLELGNNRTFKWKWLETMQFVSEEYCHHVLTRSAASGCGKQRPFRNIHPWKQSYQATRLGELMTFISCFNFKLSECIGVFGYYIRDVVDCNEWKTEKRHECTNMGKVKGLEFWWQLYRTSLPERDSRNIRPLDFCWTECTIIYWKKKKEKVIYEVLKFEIHYIVTFWPL